MEVFVKVILTLLVAVLANCDEERPLVTIEDGSIRGTFRLSHDGRKYMAFEGIPFAQPPVQKLRFREPEPVEPWLGVLDGTSLYTCVQMGFTGDVMGQEDCLYLNVYVPRERIDPEEKLDVIAHIHGGAFMMGNSHMFSGPLHIMDRDLIYVSFNYRLGPFGFFSTGDKVFHGNFGLKDQAAALQWIQKNIGKFGGNNDSVMLTGVSAGGASVHLHYLAESSKGLFHRGFAHSGAALNPWAAGRDPWTNAKIIAAEVGCMDENVKVIYRCLKQRSALQIMASVKKLMKEPLLPLVPFGPSPESYMHTAFLVTMPYLMLASKAVYDVPLLISVTTEEGTLPAAGFYNRIDELNERWNELLPIILEYTEYDEEKKDKVSAQIKEFYFDNEPVTKENFEIFVKLCTHRLFHMGAEKSAKLQASATESEVYFLMMGYAGDNLSVIPGAGHVDVDLGVGHGMDAKFYYDISQAGMKNVETENELKMKDILLDMLESYAKTGKPTIEGVNFQPVPASGNLKYLSVLGPDNISMKSIKRLGPHEFWKSLELKEEENAYIIGNNTIEIL